MTGPKPRYHSHGRERPCTTDCPVGAWWAAQSEPEPRPELGTVLPDVLVKGSVGSDADPGANAPRRH